MSFTTTCTHFNTPMGCRNGDKCKFTHVALSMPSTPVKNNGGNYNNMSPYKPPQQSPLCKFDNTPTGCTKINCVFSHNNKSAPMCKFENTLSGCTNANCTFSHGNKGGIPFFDLDNDLEDEFGEEIKEEFNYADYSGGYDSQDEIDDAYAEFIDHLRELENNK